MELNDVSRAVAKRWWVVLAALLAGIAVSLGSIAMTAPVYQSSVGFFVVAPTAERLSALEADNLVRGRIPSYASLVTSDRFLEQVVASTGKGLTKQQAASNITAFGDANSLLLQVQVNDVDKERSLATASAIATNFGALVNELEGRSRTEESETVLNVVSGPTLAADPVAPRKSLNLGLGILLGLAVGLALALALQRRDHTIRDANQLDPVVPLLAVIPRDKAARNAGLMMAPHANSVLDEAARKLRTSISFHPDAPELQVLAVTASATADGSTLTAMALAKAMAETGRKVLLVDANLRLPEVAARLGLRTQPGLSDVLAGTSTSAAATQPTDNAFLDVLVAGTHTDKPAELLNGAIAKVVGQLREHYESIVIDTSALSVWTDAGLVAAAGDGTLVVVRHGRTTPALLAASLRTLSTVHATVLGTVLNAQPMKRAQGQEVLAGGGPLHKSGRSGHADDGGWPDRTVQDQVPPGKAARKVRSGPKVPQSSSGSKT